MPGIYRKPIMMKNPSITISPADSMVDVPFTITLQGFDPHKQITITSRLTDAADVVWTAHATYNTGDYGELDLSKQAPIYGSFSDADPMGFIWSMTPEDEALRYTKFSLPKDLAPKEITFQVTSGDEVVTEAKAVRRVLVDGVQRIEVRENGLFGTLFLPNTDAPYPTIIHLVGSSGGLSEYEGALYASHGYATFALAYFRYMDLPKILVDIPLEYFVTAIRYLQSRHDIDGDRIGVYGRSRGGELALLLGSLFPEIKAVIAAVPSGIVWGGFGHDSSEGSKPAWIRNNQAIPYIDTKVSPETNHFYENCIRDGTAIPGVLSFQDTIKRYPSEIADAEISVEKINGAILMFSAQDDQIWPSALMTDMIVNRLKSQQFQHPYEHIVYPQAGHMIPPPYIPTTVTSAKHPVNGYHFAYGGQPDMNYKASVDSWEKTLSFLGNHL